MRDEEIRDLIRSEFDREFTKKFNAGIREHNPDGTKGLWRMEIPALIAAVKEEVHDLLAYITVIEKRLLAAEAVREMKTKKQSE
jgi:hypothetical protein